MSFVVFGMIAACGSSASTTSDPASPKNDASTNDDASTDGGFANGCTPDKPIRYVVGPTSDPFGPNLYDACEALPSECDDADAGVLDGSVTDTTKRCKCVTGVKGGADDAGQSSCPGRGPIYCDVLEDSTLRFRCSPP